MKVVIYGKVNCPDCARAAMLCDMQEIKPTIKQLGIDYTQADLEALAGTVKSVPQIFVNDKLVGGYEQFRRKVYSSLYKAVDI